ncbi:a-factor receptor, variant 2 [Puccinia graminis f. sp. tritici]|uniref:A-factor receptor, variant 2 n=1 Tax=Puccinia graminis f. sp. tritici TaxID=56615 RepID=A0A5B0RCQ6_PUCGR|nr:a-factor receptor, variant 2 [Puccinia graminis f. sp. tritici]KAA1123556.1 a-factor receptor, variant 2 [Puccinia graminis f. sp. tritici]
MQQVNGILWMDDAQDKAPIFCDVSAKLTMVGPLGLLIANCCIIRYLARIVTPNPLVEENSTTRIRICTDYALSFGIPAFVAVLSVVFQVSRYEVEALVGCSNVSVLAWPTIFIFIIWSPIMCGIACGYSLYVLYWLIRQHRELSHLIARSRTPLNKSRFMRMCALAATYLCISAPYTIAGTVTILKDIGPFVPWKSWGYIHDVDNKFSDVRKNASYQLNIRDWLSVTAGLTVFFFFSFANESIAVYVKIARSLRLDNVLQSSSDWLCGRSNASRSLLKTRTDVSNHSPECVSDKQHQITFKPRSSFSQLPGSHHTRIAKESSCPNTIFVSVVKHTKPDFFEV